MKLDEQRSIERKLVRGYYLEKATYIAIQSLILAGILAIIWVSCR